MNKKFFYLIILLSIFVTLNAYSEDWVMLNTPPLQQVNTVHFINKNTGFVTAGNQIYKTSDQGQSWILSTNTTYQSFYTQFLNANTGFTYGNYKIQSTTNCGSSWEVKTLDSVLQSIYFADESTWYISTVNNALQKTTNKGITWQYLDARLPASYTYRTIHFINSATGFIAGDNGGGVSALGLIRKTTDGGLTWQTRNSFTGVQPRSFTFLNASTGYLIAQYKVFKTTDGGNNWTQTLTGLSTTDDFRYITFPNANTGYASGSNTSIEGGGRIIKTTNAGQSWFYILNSSSIFFSEICFTTDSIGYVGGGVPMNTGYVMKTTTGGLTYVSSNSNVIPDKFHLYQNYPNPFNPLTRINYELPVSDFVSLKIYDALGNEVSTLINEKQMAGSYSTDFNASALPSGVYFYKLETGSLTETKKMMLLK